MESGGTWANALSCRTSIGPQSRSGSSPSIFCRRRVKPLEADEHVLYGRAEDERRPVALVQETFVDHPVHHHPQWCEISVDVRARRMASREGRAGSTSIA